MIPSYCGIGCRIKTQSLGGSWRGSSEQNIHNPDWERASRKTDSWIDAWKVRSKDTVVGKSISGRGSIMSRGKRHSLSVVGIKDLWGREMRDEVKIMNAILVTSDFYPNLLNFKAMVWLRQILEKMAVWRWETFPLECIIKILKLTYRKPNPFPSKPPC